MTQPIDQHITTADWCSPVRDECEIMNEAMKLTRANRPAFTRRVVMYNDSPIAQAQRARNFMPHHFSERVELVAPQACELSLSECMNRRESLREFSKRPLTRAELSNVLATTRPHKRGASAAGPDPIDPRDGLRATTRAHPSAGAIYPIETYVCIFRVEGLRPCLAHYDSLGHRLELIEGSTEKLAAALTDPAREGPDPALVIFPTTVFDRSTVKYGMRGFRFAMLEAGMVGFLYDLACATNDLGSSHWGGYIDDEVNDLFGLDGLTQSVVDCLLVGGKPDAASRRSGPR